MQRLARLGILVGPKSRGSNMIAIANACANDCLSAQVVAVVASATSSPAVAEARNQSLSVRIVNPDAEDYRWRLLQTLRDAECDVLCLAGYLRLLPAEVLAAYPSRVLNIHPALLPKFGGKGMYGRKVHEAVLASGDRESGCTVHCVNAHYDDGEIILQLKCPVMVGDTVDQLAARVLELEHQAYPLALKKVLENWKPVRESNPNLGLQRPQ